MIDGKRLDLPTWNHLWFLAYVWWYSMLFAILARLVPQLFTALNKLVDAHLRGIWILMVPVAYLAIVRMTLLSEHPPTNNLTNDWFNHATYLFLFLFGFIAAKQTRFWSDVAQVRWRSLSIAVVSWVFLISYFSYYHEGRELPQGMLYFQRAVWALMAWNAILALCGFARQHWNRDHRKLDYLNQAVFPVYILYQSLIIIFAYQLRPFHLPAPLEGVILIALTLGASLIAYEVIRRVAVLRPLFGLKLKK